MLCWTSVLLHCIPRLTPVQYDYISSVHLGNRHRKQTCDLEVHATALRPGLPDSIIPGAPYSVIEAVGASSYDSLKRAVEVEFL